MSTIPPDSPPPSRADDDEPPLPAIEALWLHRLIGLLGASGVAAGAAVIASGATIPGAFILAASGFQFGTALRGGRLARGRQLLAAARDAVELGKLLAAEHLLARAGRHGAAAGRSAAVVRASIRLQLDDPAGAALLASGAIGSREPGRPAGLVWITIVEALGIRALARAATGDAEGAEADAKRIAAMLERGTDVGAAALGAGHLIEEARARAALAGAIGLARSGDRDALRAHLAVHQETLHSATRPRERALLRGFERMLASDRVSPYRGRGEAPNEPASTDDWVATMLPGVAPFVAPRSARDAAPLPHVTTGTLAAPPEDWSSTRRIGGLVASWVAVAIAAFLVNFVDFPGLTRNLVFLVSMMTPMVFAMGILAFAVGRGFRSVSRRQKLADAIVLSVRTGHMRSLEGLTRAPEPAIAAQAMLALARRKNLEGDFAGARDLAAEGLLKTNAFLRRAETETELRPALVAELALAHAALGQADDALAEVESIAEGFAHRARARFGVRLVAAAASGDIAAATALAERRPADLPLDRPIEALVDVLRLHAEDGTLGLAERTRVTNELSRCADLQVWLGRVVPRIIDQMDLEPVSGQRVRVDIAEAMPAAADAPEIAEARAEDEIDAAAEAAAPRVRRRTR